jgi:hypothetical protein
LADALADPDASLYAYQLAQAATELRRLHAENASLAAALASSCDEQRHELWESGGIAGCDRARVAERQRDALLEVLKLARSIIGHPDDAHSQMIDAAIKTVEETK